MVLENGDKAQVTVIAHEVAEEEVKTCPKGVKHDAEIKNLTTDVGNLGTAAADRAKTIHKKMDDNDKKQDKRWWGLMIGTISQLIAFIVMLVMLFLSNTGGRHG